MIQMQWWDKLGATVDIIWLVVFGIIILASVVLATRNIDVVDKQREEGDSYLEEYERELENMKVERKGWISINGELRSENEELKRKNAELILEQRHLRNLLKTSSVVTLEDLDKELDSYHARMMEYMNEQDQVLAAYTTGNFLVANTEYLQKRLDAMANAEEHILNAKEYILLARTVSKE